MQQGRDWLHDERNTQLMRSELVTDYANMGNVWSQLANVPEACKNWQQAERLYLSVGKEKEAGIVVRLLGK